MKKFICLFLCTVLLIAVSSSIPATANALNSTETAINFEIEGISMTTDTFTRAYSGNPQTRKSSPARNASNSPTLTISKIAINERFINLTAQLTTHAQTIPVSINGILSAGFRSQAGTNSIIVEVQNTNLNFNILLFEIFNDSTSDTLLISDTNTFSNSPHMKIYMQDSDNNIHLFVSKIPEELIHLNAANYPLASKNSDALWWARNLVERTPCELTTDSKILSKLGFQENTRGLTDTSRWENTTTFYDTFYLGSSLVECWSLPYIEYRHTNVTSANHTWIARFKIEERTEIDGIVYYGNNAYQYRNVHLAFGAGDNTIFISTSQQGRFTDSLAIIDKIKENSSSVTVNLLRYADERFAGSTFATVVDILKSVTTTTETVELSSDTTTLMIDDVTAVGEKLPTKYILEKSTNQANQTGVGDYFVFHATTQYDTGTGSNSSSTVGALEFSFDVEYDGELTKRVRQLPLYYTATP